MAKADPSLVALLAKRLKYTPRHVNRLIASRVGALSVPPDVAAISLAIDNGVNVNRFATPEQLASLRGVRGMPAVGTSAAQPPATISAESKKAIRKARSGAGKAQKRGKSVFLVHGRNERVRMDFANLLRSLEIKALEFGQAIAKTKKGAPYIGEILDAALREVAAVVVLFTPDDEARLRKRFLQPGDGQHERKLTGQARANVLFEAGLAFGRHPDSTVLVQVGRTRPLSDLAGRHVVHLTNSAKARADLVTKLSAAGCEPNTTGIDWLTTGDFDRVD